MLPLLWTTMTGGFQSTFVKLDTETADKSLITDKFTQARIVVADNRVFNTTRSYCYG